MMIWKICFREFKKITVSPIVDANRPTTNKNSIISEDYRMIKIDTLDNQPINTNIIKNSKFIKGQIWCNDFSDFRHGIFHRKYSNISYLS